MANGVVMIHESASTLEATQRIIKILDAKYKKEDLNAWANTMGIACSPDIFQAKMSELMVPMSLSEYASTISCASQKAAR